MSQHFLLSAEARTLSLASIYKGGEDTAYGTFCRMRWAETEGAPVCPRCGSLRSYDCVGAAALVGSAFEAYGKLLKAAEDAGGDGGGGCGSYGR